MGNSSIFCARSLIGVTASNIFFYLSLLLGEVPACGLESFSIFEKGKEGEEVFCC